MTDADNIILSEAARLLQVPPALLSSLRYRGLLPDSVIQRQGNRTWIARSFLPELRQIIAARTKYSMRLTNLQEWT